MSVDRSDLHHLVDELPDDQVASAADELRRRTRAHRTHAHKPLSWMAMGPSRHASTEDARRVDEILAEELGRG
ncbi:hypothetical protein [Nocardioides sp.]|uniref:hypothetical protein n=1 Tax=Nocardioides sp. TaxID=35761 RepID=UPI0039E6419E